MEEYIPKHARSVADVDVGLLSARLNSLRDAFIKLASLQGTSLANGKASCLIKDYVEEDEMHINSYMVKTIYGNKPIADVQNVRMQSLASKEGPEIAYLNMNDIRELILANFCLDASAYYTHDIWWNRDGVALVVADTPTAHAYDNVTFHLKPVLNLTLSCVSVRVEFHHPENTILYSFDVPANSPQGKPINEKLELQILQRVEGEVMGEVLVAKATLPLQARIPHSHIWKSILEVYSKEGQYNGWAKPLAFSEPLSIGYVNAYEHKVFLGFITLLVDTLGYWNHPDAVVEHGPAFSRQQLQQDYKAAVTTESTVNWDRINGSAVNRFLLADESTVTDPSPKWALTFDRYLILVKQIDNATHINTYVMRTSGDPIEIQWSTLPGYVKNEFVSYTKTQHDWYVWHDAE